MIKRYLNLEIPFGLLPEVDRKKENFLTRGPLMMTGLRAYFIEGPNSLLVPTIGLLKFPLYIPVGHLDLVKYINHFNVQVGRPTFLPYGWFDVVKKTKQGELVKEPPAITGLNLRSNNTLFASNIHILHYYNSGEQISKAPKRRRKGKGV